MEKYAVILAGGSGTRLWPLSRESKPKQFISVDGNKSFLVQTIERICEVIPAENCFVITSKVYLDMTKEAVKDLIPISNIISDPLKKNTAASIAYATLYLEKMFGRGVVCFIPADSYVKNKTDYQNTVRQAYQAAESSGKIMIIGVKPTYPSTGFGYIQIDSEDQKGISKVVQFKEKPNRETAEDYVKADKYLWNSGMVAGQLHVLAVGIRHLMPEHYARLSEALTYKGTSDFLSSIETAYSSLEDISFDYAFLEKSHNLLAIKGDFDWYDIGSLDAVSILLATDDHNNSIFGKHLGIDTENSTIYSLDSLITTIGLSDMIIMEIDGMVIVCPKTRAQDVKALVRMLKKNGYEKYL
ncbi:mannose-1-phosphate guanylyltransferase [Sporolactobacillus putidus]|uniref:Mannose-1-phosphate guanylyltransferase n=1 Tax=Sporolactobacillus putidus TaxID=492735 RepID=A0A917S1G2_9BACL|nr:mannose-1-phosphate guanylyltransferase [Sporolactobacillus putidus]GGL48502.1 mannose-1-phosphate guanylyltransferase [Sporolactobacillus putidus]